MKLVFFGNSLTAGFYGGNFVDQIAEKLPQHTVINAGAGGDTIVNLLARLDRDVLSHKPDAAFVMCVENDALSYQYPAIRPYYKRAKNLPDGFVSLETYAQTYREVLTCLQAADVKLWMGLSSSEYSSELVETMRQYNEAAAEIAHDLDILVLDLTAYLDTSDIPDRPPLGVEAIQLIGQRQSSGWKDYENERQTHGFKYTFDGVHLTPTTASLFAEQILKFLNL